MITGEEYQNEMNKYIRKDSHYANVLTAFFAGLLVMVIFNITAASSMSGATQTLREKGEVTHDNGQYYFIYSQEQPLEELDYLSLARLSKYNNKGVIIITD
jgi:hypothetical protein